MSERTQCNYCRWQKINADAREKESKVYLISSIHGGYDVFVVPKGEKLDTSRDKDGNNISGQFVAWFMELPTHCVC